MPRFARSIVGLLLALPAPALAQTKALTASDVIGTWVSVFDPASFDGRNLVYYLTLKSDSTWTTRTTMDGKEWGVYTKKVNGVEKTDSVRYYWGLDGRISDTEGRWSLAGDTLKTPKTKPIILALQNGQLSLRALLCLKFDRFDASKPLPAPHQANASCSTK